MVSHQHLHLAETQSQAGLGRLDREEGVALGDSVGVWVEKLEAGSRESGHPL